jgi:uncharacterized membrane protein YgcG
MSAKVNIDIVTQVKGLDNLTKGEHQIKSFGQSVTALGKTFAKVFVAKEIVDFGKASVQAFANNQKQVLLLTNTLKNLGLGMQAFASNQFIDHLSLATGKTKEELIPAFQGLVVATNSTIEAQKALQVALDVSQGTGKDLATVQIALSKGFLGNTTALTRLGAGLDKATLKTGDMNLIMKRLEETFSGSAKTAAESFQGSLDRLNVAATEAKVTIGGDLVQAFTDLSGSGGFTSTITAIGTLSNLIGDAIVGFSRLFREIEIITSAKSPLDMVRKIIAAQQQFNKEDMLLANQRSGIASQASSHLAVIAAQNIALQKQSAAEKKIADAANATKKAKADTLALQRSQLSLSLAGSTTDMQNIEIQAALQRGQTEQVNNVLLLQRALITGNADEANILAQKVLTANGLVMDVNGNITALAGAKDPFKDWPTAAQSAIDQLKKVNDYLATIKDKTITITVNTVTTSTGSTTSIGGGGSSSGGGGAKGGTPGPSNPIDPQSPTPVIIIPPSSSIPNGGSDLGAGNSGGFSSVVAKAMGYTDANPTDAASLTEYNKEKYGNAGAAPIVINISAPPSTTVTTTQDASTNGTPVTVNRNNPFGMYSV